MGFGLECLAFCGSLCMSFPQSVWLCNAKRKKSFDWCWGKRLVQISLVSWCPLYVFFSCLTPYSWCVLLCGLSVRSAILRGFSSGRVCCDTQVSSDYFTTALSCALCASYSQYHLHGNHTAFCCHPPDWLGTEFLRTLSGTSPSQSGKGGYLVPSPPALGQQLCQPLI